MNDVKPRVKTRLGFKETMYFSEGGGIFKGPQILQHSSLTYPELICVAVYSNIKW